MPFEIIRGDITELNIDAIVNAANPEPIIGYGVDAGLHQKAGLRLLKARKKIGPIPVGQAALTHGFDLPAKYVIHGNYDVFALNEMLFAFDQPLIGA